MKYTVLMSLLCVAGGLLQAAALPDNIYFKAMRDEMARTTKQLRVKGSAEPFYVVYRLNKRNVQSFTAEMGQVYRQAAQEPVSGVTMAGYIYAGTARHNSSGYRDPDYYGYRVLSGYSGDSYEALRQNLWQLTDLEYIKASTLAEKKEAYKRRKNLQDEPPDFSTAPHASYVEEMRPFQRQDPARYNLLVEQLSEQGKTLAYLERYQVAISFAQEDRYFLDSEQNFYQFTLPVREVRFAANLRNQDGYKIALKASYPLPMEDAQIESFTREKAAQFLQRVEQQRTAKKVEPYVGPVLFMADAAGGFFDQLFIGNINNTKPLLSANQEIDPSAGLFKDKLNMRVLSPMFDVFDRPQLRQYQGIWLGGFMPVDAEGVAAQELHLVEKGRLKNLPTIRSLMKGQTHSNGHARSTVNLPRAKVTNVFFEPSETVPADQLEAKLLERSRELGLEYAYIFHSFPSVIAERIYTADGHKEMVYGIELEKLTARSLRDIVAAGDDSQVTSAGYTSIIAPSILVDEIEFVPSQNKPARKPFVPLPK